MTAVEFLFSKLMHDCSASAADIELLQEALEFEKEQHKKTWFDSTAQFDSAAEMSFEKDFNEYYSEKVKQSSNEKI